jgi:hypothetical protein
LTDPTIATACRTELIVAARPYSGEFTTRSRFPASTASVSMIAASSPNDTSSSASVASSLVSTGEKGGSLSSSPMMRSRAVVPLSVKVPMSRVSARIGIIIASTRSFPDSRPAPAMMH